MNIAVHTFGRLRAGRDEPEVAEFANAVPAVFALAARSEGFVWRADASVSAEAQADRDAYSTEADIAMASFRVMHLHPQSRIQPIPRRCDPSHRNRRSRKHNLRLHRRAQWN